MIRRIILAAAVLALPVISFAQTDPVVSGENIFVPARTTGTPAKLFKGTDRTGAPVLLYATVSSTGQAEILREGDRNPVLTEEDLPGRRRLVSQNGQLDLFCVQGIMYFIAYDATATVGPNRVAYIMKKELGSQGQAETIMARDNTVVDGFDPRVGNAPGQFTWLQTLALDISPTGRLLAYGLATPPVSPGTAPGSSPHVNISQLEGSSWKMIYNNQLQTADRARLSSLSGFCTTGTNTLYILGRAGDVPNTTPTNAFTVFRVVNRELQQARQYLPPVGVGMNCTENGVQTYYAEVAENTLRSFVYAFIPDSAPAGGNAFSAAEQPFFKGLIADTIPLDSRDRQVATSGNESYLVMGNGSLMKMGQQPKLIKAPGQNPQGNVTDAVKVGDQIVFLSGGRAFYVYSPTVQSPLSGRPGDRVSISCKDCVVGGRVPSMQLRLSGQDTPYGVTSTGEISFTIPSGATVGAYEGTVNVSGLARSFVLNVRPGSEPATPSITLVTTFSGGTGPFGARSTVNVMFTGDTGRAEAASQDTATYEMSGMSLSFDGEPVRLLGNNSRGTLTALLPRSAGTKSQGSLVLSVTSGGVTVSSAPFRLSTAEVANSLTTFPDFGTGRPTPMLSSEGGVVGISFNPLAANSKVRAFGTGCGSGQTDDSANVPEPGIEAGETGLQIGGSFITAKVTVAPNTPGLCYYDFTMPQGMEPGPQTFGFVGSSEFFYVWVK